MAAKTTAARLSDTGELWSSSSSLAATLLLVLYHHRYHCCTNFHPK